MVQASDGLGLCIVSGNCLFDVRFIECVSLMIRVADSVYDHVLLYIHYTNIIRFNCKHVITVLLANLYRIIEPFPD